MKHYVIMSTALSLLLLILLPACGSDGGETILTPTTTAIPDGLTPAPANFGTAAPTATQTGPVKIGAIQPWSGPAAIAGISYADPAIKLVEKQVKDNGGILGGRPLSVVKYDNRNTVADSVGGAKKLILEDKVSALVFGGTTSAQCAAVSDAAAESQVLFITNAPLTDLAERENTLEATLPSRVIVDDTVKLVTKELKPKTVAILASGGEYIVDTAVPAWKKQIEEAGSKVVYLETPQVGVQDFMPYLTKIKFYNPDVFILGQGSEQSMAIAKQIMELGGWGDIQVVAMSNSLAAAKMPGAQGWLVLVFWHPDLSTPESVIFKKDFQSANGKVPEPNHVFYYLCLWAAIHSIELAGTAEDTGAIVRAARSGNLEFDTPVGRAHYTIGGDSGLSGMFVQVQKSGTTTLYKNW